MRLREIAPDRYARAVLPLTAPMWAGRRTFDEYVDQTLEIARSPYGRRHYRTIGLYDGSTLVTSFKRYERSVLNGGRRLRAIGFGAVFTPPEYRGRGYASVMIAMALDQARNEGYEAAYLFSDIRPQFYAALGFRALASRRIWLRADALPTARLRPAWLGDDDWNGVRHVYELCERGRSEGFARSATSWGFIRMRMDHDSEHQAGRQTNLVVRRRRGIAAYVFGVRAPEHDAYFFDEYGFADAAAAAEIPALLRAAAGDLRRVTGWLPPSGARELLPSGAVRRRSRAIFMMAPLRPDGAQLVDAIAARSRSDFCWATDHI
jgi:predicted N-acetyltransferase YhbS